MSVTVSDWEAIAHGICMAASFVNQENTLWTLRDCDQPACFGGAAAPSERFRALRSDSTGAPPQKALPLQRSFHGSTPVHSASRADDIKI